MTRSLYAILNVAPDADPAVIDAAYKALMKKYHPDVLVGESAGKQSRAAEINRAFQILRDPEKRADYDAQEQARQRAVRMAMHGPNMRQMQPQPAQPAKRSKWPAFLLIVIVAALIVYAWQMSEGGQQFASAIPREPVAIEERTAGSAGTEPASAPLDEASIDRAIAESRRINKESGPVGLSGYSQDCFASQSRSVSLAQLDFCVAFDSAALVFDAESPRIYSLLEVPRFQTEEMTSRHLNAAKTISEDDAWALDRLTQIRLLTAARLDEADAPPPEAPAPASYPAPNLPSNPAPKPVPAPASEKSEPRRMIAAARPQRKAAVPPPAQRKKPRPSDSDFLERQGYIY